LGSALDKHLGRGISFVTVEMLHLLDKHGSGGNGRRLVDFVVDGINKVLHTHLQSKLKTSAQEIL
jgi:hypothetical protein